METIPHVNKKNGQINIVLGEQNEIESQKQYREIAANHRPFSKIDEYFQSFVGLKELKQIAKQIYSSMITNNRRKEFGLKTNDQVLHMMFKGNPGTGKTTVARKLAQMLFDLDILEKGQFIEAERADLVGEYIGQTAQKTRSIVQKSLGGVLFIDEAYSLGRGGSKDFGKEAIDTLVKNMEDFGDQFVLILAGYPDEMDRFLQLNPGLESRFPFVIEFENYSLEELMEIMENKFRKTQYQISKTAWTLLRKDLQVKRMADNFSNGRYVRNIVEKAIRMHAIRVVTRDLKTEEQLSLITEQDIVLH